MKASKDPRTSAPESTFFSSVIQATDSTCMGCSAKAKAIHHAARNGDTEIVRLLIEAGADVNAANPRGHTVLYCAGGHGHLDSVKLLLDNGADPHAKFTDDGKDLLGWLAQFESRKVYRAIAKAIRDHINEKAE